MHQFNEESRYVKLGDKIGLILKITTKYLVPTATGFYVGMMEGSNLKIEPAAEYAALLAPTLLNVGLVACVGGIAKTAARKCIDTLEFQHGRYKKAYSNLEWLANTSVTEQTAKASVTPAFMTTLGFTFGYLYSKHF